MIAKFGGIDQWVIVTEDEIIGVAKNDGTQLWRHEFSETGLTNVPSPLVVDNSRLLVSGQGCKGVRCLGVTLDGSNWTVGEKWFQPRIQFFYTNWAKLTDRIVIGCTDKYLAAIDLDDGAILGRFRGFSNGNVVLAGDKVLLVDGRGKLNVLLPASDSDTINGFDVESKYGLMRARCWTPLSIIGDRILVRGNDRLICLTLNDDDDLEPLESIGVSSDKLEFERVASGQTKVDPVEKIFATFESKGQDAALAIYTKFRSDKKLNEQSMIALAEAAQEQGLADIAKMIITHAGDDFPDSKDVQSTAKSILGK